MPDLNTILSQIEAGDSRAADQLLPLAYEELRRIAADKLAREKPRQTLQATALVHEAYLRLIGSAEQPRWQGRGHFVTAAAEAMRRILVESARRKSRLKRGGDRERLTLADIEDPATLQPDALLGVDTALDKLSARVRFTAQERNRLVRFPRRLTASPRAHLLSNRGSDNTVGPTQHELGAYYAPQSNG